MLGKLRIVHSAFLGGIGLKRGQITELALTGGVVHQADNTDPV